MVSLDVVLSLVVILAVAAFVILVVLPKVKKAPLKRAAAPGPVAPPAGRQCKCYTDIWERKPGSASTPDTGLEARDNKTFCGFENDGYLWGCSPSECRPACV